MPLWGISGGSPNRSESYCVKINSPEPQSHDLHIISHPGKRHAVSLRLDQLVMSPTDNIAIITFW